MTAATRSGFGAINGASDKEALFLKVFGGEVLTSFHDTEVTLDKHMVRTIASGKSAQFPVAGTVTASYHVPGAEIVGQAVNHNEIVVSIDDLLIAPVFIPQIDEAMNHYDVRRIYSFEAGKVLAEQMDQHVLQQGYIAAASAATLTGGNAGTQVTDADADTNGSSLASSLYDLAEALDDNKVPADPRFAFLAPAQYYLLAETTNVINRDWGGEGSYAAGKVFRVAGLNIVKTTNLPNGSNINSAPAHGDGDTRHAVNATNYVSAVWHPSAVGTVKLINVQTDMDWDFRRQGTLIVAKYAMGHAALRPESAGLIKTA